MNVLVVGLGVIALKHINALKTAVKDPNIFALRSGYSKNEVEGVTNIYNLDDLSEKIDFAIISNSTHAHYDTIKELSERKIDFFIEKPPVHSLDGIDILLDNIKNNQIITYTACNLRFHPCLIKLKEIVEGFQEDEVINEANVYCGTYLPDWRPGKDWRKMYSANEEMGGGVHLDLFHEIDYTHWILGSPINSNRIHSSKSSLNISAVDYANYIWEYKNYQANITLNYYRRDPKRTFEIVTSKRTLTTDLISHDIKQNGKVIFQAKNFTVLDTYPDQMKYFVNQLRLREECENNFKNAIKAFTLCIN